MKKYLSSKLTSFLLYIAGNDDGLKLELERIGPVGVIAISVVISVGCSLLLVFLVAS